jgi:subtilisin family serine protease
LQAQNNEFSECNFVHTDFMKLNSSSRLSHQDQSAQRKMSIMKAFLFRSLSVIGLSAGLTACLQTPAPVASFMIYSQNTRAASVQVPAQASVQFIAVDPSNNPISVTWSIKEGATHGSIDGQGRYTAPNAAPDPAQATVVATTSSARREYIVNIVQAGLTGIRGTATIPVDALQTPRAEPQGIRSFKANWNAPRVKGQLLVIPSGNARPQSLATTSSLRGVQVRAEGDALTVEVPVGVSDQAFAEQLSRETGASVQPRYIYRGTAIPNDTSYAQQSNLPQISAPAAWDLQSAVADNMIAILDTGLVKTLSEIQGRYTEGKDFCSVLKNPNQNNAACDGEDTDVSDIPASQQGNGHGTFIAGQIAAVTNNSAGMAGLAHSGKVLIVKVFSSDNLGPLADSVSLSKGINYAVAQGARVLNLSLGVCAQYESAFDGPDQLVAKSIQAARAAGAVVVTAAGNNGASGCGTDYGVMFPGNHPDVIAVGSVDSDNAKSYFSATGPQVSIVAPGGGILSLNQTGTLETKAGTSFAAPQVAAIAGLILTKYPALQTNTRETSNLVRVILEETAQDLGTAGKDNSYGAGLLRADLAIERAWRFVPQIEVFAYPLKPGGNPSIAGDYDTASTAAAQTLVTLLEKSGSSSFSMITAKDGNPIKPGTYRVVACVDVNKANGPCSSGDLVDSKQNLPFEVVLDGVQLSLSRL